MKLARWSSKLASILIEAKVPALQDVADIDLERFALRLSGSSRASTLKKHVQSWLRYTRWLLASYAVSWPSGVGMVVDFLEDLAARPCGVSVPSAFIGTLTFMARVGDISIADKLSAKPVVRRCLDQIVMQLESNAEPSRKARPHPLMVIIAMELFVVCDSAPRYFRAFAWAKLVKFWTSSRCDDLAGLLPSSLSLDHQGLCAYLRRRKTSGPGKKIKWLPLFVDCAATFSGVDWLRAGFAIWRAEDFNFDRDYLIPLPSSNLQSCKQCMADYTAVSTLSKLLYRELWLPCWAGDVWPLSDSRLLISQSACRAWTEHSERCWLASAAAVLSVPREKRDFLGRWHVSCSGDEYIRTARGVVCGLQRDMVRGVLADEQGTLKGIGLKELELHLRSCGESDSVILEQLRLMDVGLWSVPPPFEFDDQPLPRQSATMSLCDRKWRRLSSSSFASARIGACAACIAGAAAV